MLASTRRGERPTMKAAWLFALAVSGAANASTYDAVADFSAAVNTGTVWSYLYTDSLQTTPSLLTTLQPVAPGVNEWWTAGVVPDSVIVGRNSSGMPYTSSTVTYPTNELTMDPESGSAIVQFTAPAAGTYAMTVMTRISPAHKTGS